MADTSKRVQWITSELKKEYTYIDIGEYDFPEQYQEIVEFILSKNQEYDA